MWSLSALGLTSSYSTTDHEDAFGGSALRSVVPDVTRDPPGSVGLSSKHVEPLADLGG
jgi:hypothetical protein